MMVNDESSGDESASTDLSAALDEVLGKSEDAGEGYDGGLDLSALEEAVAELGLDVAGETSAPDTAESPAVPAPSPLVPPDVADAADDGPMTFEVERESTNPGLDLTELPPPPLSATPSSPTSSFGDKGAGRDLPPLGEATADDLFGPIDDDPGLPSSWEPDPPAERATPAASAPPPPPPPTAPAIPDFERESSAAAPADFEESAPPSEPVQIPAPQPAPIVEADPAMAGVVGFTAHGGTITGEIRDKAKRLFGRGKELGS